MAAQIAVGGLGGGLEARELHRLGVALGMQRGHDLQPQGLVDQFVQLSHAQALRSHRPDTNSPPPPAAAIQKARYGWKKKKPTRLAMNTAAPIHR